MPKITVKLVKTEDRSYEIVVESGIMGQIPVWVKDLVGAHNYAIITDSNVEELYGGELLALFKEAGLEAHLISFPAGEENKTRTIKAQIEDAMSHFGLGRDSAVVALGGGVAGDIAGYVAATYTRGVPYVQVPTTVVACVDSSVGGKTGVDTRYGKNLIGAFYQPRAVYIDTSTLKTLAPDEIRNGLAEVIKYGVIWDKGLFEFLENNIDKILALDEEAINHIVLRSCQIKAEVVEKDERESNLRKVLNFGHTIGHAIENLSSYKMKHGEAISIGMALEGEIAVRMGLWEREDVERLKALFQSTGLPTETPEEIDLTATIELMKLDKKARKGKIEMALPTGIGTMATHEGQYGIHVEEESIKDLFASL